MDFYENKSKIVRKSSYHRKYHIQNTINRICREQKLQILNCDQRKIYRVYNEINNILPQINNNRKRMISTNFILRNLFKMLNYSTKTSKFRNRKKTLAFYEKYWKEIKKLKGDEIEIIVA